MFLKKSSFYAFISIFFGLFALCFVSSYHPKDIFQKGYCDKKLSKGVYSISYYGYKNTPNSLMEKYALIRAAEVTENEGYRYFTVKEKKDISKTALEEKIIGTNQPEYPGIELTIVCYEDSFKNPHAYSVKKLRYFPK